MLEDSDAGAPWIPTVRRDIVNMVRFLRGDLVSVLPDASEDELARVGAPVPPGEVAGATVRSDWRSAIREAGDLAEGGDLPAARAVLGRARDAYQGAPFVLERIETALAELDTPGGRGPTEAQVGAAAALTESQRDAMVRGMVDGLASRLRTQPGDLDGWLMLMRSYAVLQDPERATQAARDALGHFEAGGARRQLLQAAAELGITLN